MIEVKLSFATPEECAEAMAKLARGFYEGEDKQPEDKPKKPAGKKQAKVKDPEDEAPQITKSPEDRKDPEQEADTPEQDPEQDPEPEPKKAEKKQVDPKERLAGEVRPAIARLIKAIGQDSARTFLEEYKDLGIKKLSDIPVDEYDDFIAAIDEKVAEKSED